MHTNLTNSSVDSKLHIEHIPIDGEKRGLAEDIILKALGHVNEYNFIKILERISPSTCCVELILYFPTFPIDYNKIFMIGA